jgi:hypothetical protein
MFFFDPIHKDYQPTLSRRGIVGNAPFPGAGSVNA